MGIEKEDQCEECLDALQERRDTHTKGCEQQRGVEFLKCESPISYTNKSELSLKFPNILEPWNGKVHIQA